MTTSTLPASPAAFAERSGKTLPPTSTSLPRGPLDQRTSRPGCGLVHARGAGHRGRRPGDDRLHDRHLAIRTRKRTTSASPPKSCPRWRSGAWSWPGGWSSRATSTPALATTLGPLPHRDRDLPGGERPALRGAGGAERAVPADHRLDDGGCGKARSARCRSCSPSSRAPTARCASGPSAPRPGRTSSERGELAGLFDRLYALRQQVARNAGFANYRDYVFPAKFRFDYTPADCERFHEAVEQTVAPAVERDAGVRRRPAGPRRAPAVGSGGGSRTAAAPLRPFDDGGRIRRRRARDVFERVDPALGRRVPDHDRRAAARPGQPEGQGAGRLLRDAALPRAARSSS